MTLKLVYFNIPFWRAETSRLALHLGGVPFEDVRPNREEFRQLKASGTLPYGQLPVLHIDEFVLAQSAAIARYCGQVSGHYPQDPIDAVRVDELLDTANQISGLISPSMRAKDAETKLQMRTQLAQDSLPQWFTFLSQRLDANAASPFFVGASMTVADLAIWRLLDWLTSGTLDGLPKTLLDPFPTLAAHHAHIGSHPKIQAWMAQYAR